MADNKIFISDVEGFAKLAKEKMLRVAKQSVQDLVTVAQTPRANGGDMPVDLGYLRNSITSSLEGGTAAQGNDAIVFTIAGMELGSVVTFAWTAEYAIPRHYLVNANGGLWRDKAANQWQLIVAKNAAAVK